MNTQETAEPSPRHKKLRELITTALDRPWPMPDPDTQTTATFRVDYEETSYRSADIEFDGTAFELQEVINDPFHPRHHEIVEEILDASQEYDVSTPTFGSVLP